MTFAFTAGLSSLDANPSPKRNNIRYKKIQKCNTVIKILKNYIVCLVINHLFIFDVGFVAIFCQI